jgi:hypothetical protein
VPYLFKKYYQEMLNEITRSLMKQAYHVNHEKKITKMNTILMK